MKKIVLTTITSLVLFVSSATFARTDPAILNQAAKNVVTVSKAKTLADETGNPHWNYRKAYCWRPL